MSSDGLCIPCDVAAARVPKVSIVVPSYNHGRYLSRRLKSIEAQTLGGYELVILDDASTDGSAKICADFGKAHKSCVMLNQQNSGTAFKQWAAGISASHGEYVWIAESDDYAHPRLLESLVDRLDRYPNCGLAYCQSYQVDQNDVILRTMDAAVSCWDGSRWKSDYVNSGTDECANFLALENIIPNASAVLFRRSVYERAGGVDVSLRLSADWKLWGMMLLESDVAFVARPLNYFRLHPQTVRSRTRKYLVLQESIAVMTELARRLRLTAEQRRRIVTRMAVLALDCIRHEGVSLCELRRAFEECEMARSLGDFRVLRDIGREVLAALGRRKLI